MYRIPVRPIHDAAFCEAEGPLVKRRSRLHINHRQHRCYRTVELLVEWVDFSGHNTPLVSWIFEMDLAHNAHAKQLVGCGHRQYFNEKRPVNSRVRFSGNILAALPAQSPMEHVTLIVFY